MSAIFEQFEREYAALSINIGQNVAALEDSDVAYRKETVLRTEKDLTQADELLQQMELEARSVAAKERTRLEARLKGYKADIAVLRKALKESVRNTSRSELLNGGRSPPDSSDQKQLLLQMNERTRSGTDKLRKAQQTALEAEAIGASILGDLRSQRETIMHATGTLQRANEGLARGGRVLSSISRQALANKVITWVIIVFLALLIVSIMYLELFGTGSKNPTRTGNGTRTGL